MLTLFSRFKGWIISLTGALAVVVVVMTNVDKFATLVAGWLRPWLVVNSTIEIVVDPAVNAPVIVAVMDGSKALDTKLIKFGEADTFEAPINGRYVIVWQGVGVKPSSAPDILAPRQKLRYRLGLKEKGSDGAVLALRLEGEAQDKPTADAPATALASAAAAQAVRDPAARPPSSSLLPELDRASLVVGLLETGSTNCSTSVIVNQMLVSVGCYGFSIPGWLGDVLRALSAEAPDDFAAAFEGDALSYIRAAISNDNSGTSGFLADAAKRDQLRAGLRNVVQWPAFRHRYEAKVLEGYGDALRIARQIGLRSERGVLLVFDNIISLGAGRTRQIATRYAQSNPDQSSDERTKLARYADFLRSQAPAPARKIMETRLRLLISGKARGRGISYDLNELGIRDDTDMLTAGRQ